MRAMAGTRRKPTPSTGVGFLVSSAGRAAQSPSMSTRVNGQASVSRRKSKGTDPLLSTHEWIKVIRPWWCRPENQRPCAWCGKPIDYLTPRYYPGTRRVNPASLVIGHIVGRDEARERGWRDRQINALSNTQPEHARCSDRSGAIYGNQKRGRRGNHLKSVARGLKPSTDTSRTW